MADLSYLMLVLNFQFIIYLLKLKKILCYIQVGSYNGKIENLKGKRLFKRYKNS